MYRSLQAKESMLMNLGLLKLEAGQGFEVENEKNETALVLLTGRVRTSFCEIELKRDCLFTQKPYVLQIPAGYRLSLQALESSEFLVVDTENENAFSPVLYTPDTVKEYGLGETILDGTANRIIRDVFHYENAPLSKLVLGEIINKPGRWSSYPPHFHPQPEVYFYRFDKPQGFGCSFLGDEAQKITHNSIACIDGNLTHPQASAPGYNLYYCWIIRHLPGLPWTNTRIYDKAHEWVLD